jgi:hypothetical protein
VLEFERKNFGEYEQQLAQLDWVPGLLVRPQLAGRAALR